MKIAFTLVASLATVTICWAQKQEIDHSPYLPGGSEQWSMVWNDEFDYPDNELDKRWEAQNGPSGHILCSRWRENVTVGDGTLKLINRRERRAGQEWTSGSIWSREQFQYGYFECRYRYAAAPATNNSFWLMTKDIVPQKGKKFEIDINEGHYPSEVNTNIHNWSDIYVQDGRQRHPSASKSFNYGLKPAYSFQLEIPVRTNRIRLVSSHRAHFHIGELRVYNVNAAGYPDPLSETADSDVSGLVNFARQSGVKITSSGTYGPEYKFREKNLADGGVHTRWTAQPEGEKWIELEFGNPVEVGCIQLLNGWLDKSEWKGLLSGFKIQYHDGRSWKDIVVKDPRNAACDFSKDFHVYGLEWTKDEIVFYFDGKAIRREKNRFCHSPSPVWLSLAIIPWGGLVTDAIDGTFMEVDYVRIYNRK